MSEYKNKYLRVVRKSDKLVIKREDVSHLNKKGMEMRWNEIDKEFPPSEYISCYETSQTALPVFYNPG